MPCEIFKIIPLLHRKIGTVDKYNVCFNILRSEDDCLLECYVIIRVMIIITLMMEAASTSETSVNFYQTTWCNNPEDRHLHAYCHENVKSYILLCIFI
jgi:hypothetical protein